MNREIFREYDIRGVVGRDLDEGVVERLGRAVGTFLAQRGAEEVTVGRDCRLSSGLFHQLIRQGLIGSGLEVVDIGMVPTPLLYFALHHLDLDGGVQVTGSHNPPEFNGFKVCLGKSTIYGEDIQEIRRIAANGESVSGRGQVRSEDVTEEYLTYIQNDITLGERRPLVVVDAGNGSAGMVASELYRRLGCKVISLFCEPDGRFPNHHPDPVLEENLCHLREYVMAESADLGIALDGDGDRIGVVDEKGGILWGDALLTIFARDILTRHQGAKFIAEVKCSETAFADIAQRGGQPIMWKVGHSLIKAKMREEKALLAGELSGHIFFADRYFGYDDAIYAGARLLEIFSQENRPISTWLQDLPPTCRSPEIRIDCEDSAKFEVVERFAGLFRGTNEVIEIDGARVLFPEGWALVRASNTQPALVLRFEANSQESLVAIRRTVEGMLESLSEGLGGESGQEFASHPAWT